MKVFTFHQHIPQLTDDDMLELWKKSWAREGWEPVVLTADDCYRVNTELTGEFRESILNNTRNPREYSIASMIRWAYMKTVTEPCLHVDWDVMWNGLKPSDIIIHDPVPTFLAGSTCPCAVAANPRGWRLFSAWLQCAPFSHRFDAEALMNDSCDQYATSICPSEFYFIQPGIPCKLYLEQEGWETAPMIHFPNRLTKYPRSETIKTVLKFQ